MLSSAWVGNLICMIDIDSILEMIYRFRGRYNIFVFGYIFV